MPLSALVLPASEVLSRLSTTCAEWPQVWPFGHNGCGVRCNRIKPRAMMAGAG